MAKKLCVFCGSKEGNSKTHAELAEKIGAYMAENSITLVYGGGSIGLMGVIANSVKDHGGQVIGVIPKALDERELAFERADQMIVTSNMHERKAKMSELADAYLALPGGVGTIEELFEVITWKQLGFHDKDIFLIGDNDFWQPLSNMLDNMIEQGFSSAKDGKLFDIITNIEAIVF